MRLVGQKEAFGRGTQVHQVRLQLEQMRGQILVVLQQRLKMLLVRWIRRMMTREGGDQGRIFEDGLQVYGPVCEEAWY